MPKETIEGPETPEPPKEAVSAKLAPAVDFDKKTDDENRKRIKNVDWDAYPLN